jgi:hypothetical protein
MSTDNSNRLGPSRDRRPSSRLAADNNVARPALPSHRESIALAHAQKARAAADTGALSIPQVPSAQEQLNRDDCHSDSVTESSPQITPTVSQPDSVSTPTTFSFETRERACCKDLLGATLGTVQTLERYKLARRSTCPQAPHLVDSFLFSYCSLSYVLQTASFRQQNSLQDSLHVPAGHASNSLLSLGQPIPSRYPFAFLNLARGGQHVIHRLTFLRLLACDCDTTEQEHLNSRIARDA